MATKTQEKERTVVTRVTEDFHEEIRVEAAKRDVPVSELVRTALRSELES